MPNHAHILVGQNPALALSDTVQILKTETSNFIREKKIPAISVSMAGRVWSIFACPKRVGSRDPLYFEPA